ncbi:hypothetical protein [Nocardiopsis rhodophaea]|uniref:hypothetical protein n=1 Tax=Nocardiopsis rhodophaea TaxID=280238 RepID=UPI0031D9673D
MTPAEKALQALDDSTRQYRHTEAAHEKSRGASIAHVVTALRAGARPTDVVNRSPFSPAYVRKLAREHGIEPATSKKEADT